MMYALTTFQIITRINEIYQFMEKIGMNGNKRFINKMKKSVCWVMYIYGTKGYIKSKNYITKTKKDFKDCGPFEIDIYRKKKKRKTDDTFRKNKTHFTTSKKNCLKNVKNSREVPQKVPEKYD